LYMGRHMLSDDCPQTAAGNL